RGVDLHDDVEVAVGAAVPARLALALEPDARAVLRPGRHLDLVALRRALAPRAAAVAARLLDDDAVAAAARAGLGQREQAVAVGDDARAVALRAGDRPRPGLRAGAAADVAGRLRLDRHPHGDALERVVEREAHARLEVGAALRPRPRRAAAAAAAEDAAQPAEQVGQVAEVDVLDANVLEAAEGPGARPHPGGAEAVVLPALLGVGEQVVRRLDVLEPLFGLLVARVAVRVVLARELAVRLLDLVVGRRPCDAERGVRILHRPTPPRPPGPAAAHGRPGGSPSARPAAPSRARRPRPAARAAPRGRAGRRRRRPRSRRDPPSRAPPAEPAARA